MQPFKAGFHVEAHVEVQLGMPHRKALIALGAMSALCLQQAQTHYSTLQVKRELAVVPVMQPRVS